MAIKLKKRIAQAVGLAYFLVGLITLLLGLSSHFVLLLMINLSVHMIDYTLLAPILIATGILFVWVGTVRNND